MSPLTARSSWQALQQHRKHVSFDLQALFLADADRVGTLSHTAAGITADFSKNLVTVDTLALLQRLAEEAGLAQAIEDLLSGKEVNCTEHRPALHSALRSHHADTQAQEAEVNAVLKKMATFVAAVHEGRFAGYTGEGITDVVNIGIGGSDLGPVMVSEALGAYRTGHVASHFVSNVDSTDIMTTLAGLNPATTLFVVASKTFTTIETLTNAATARDWLLQWRSDPSAIAHHFVAVSTNAEKVAEFGIAAENMFPMWDWVGGRYSLWSAIGLPIALAIGMDNFNALRAGAADMDQHFASAPLEENLPVLLGLIACWYSNFWGAHSHAVLPYDHYLRLFPKYLQQLEMESNGKCVTVDGSAVDYHTGVVIWGDAGTNGQHSFHQLLHQGSQFVPVDFIAVFSTHHPQGDHHSLLLSNCLAQSRALMLGKSTAEAEAEFIEMGYAASEAKVLAPHKVMPGNRPSTTLIIDALTPRTLGALIALYEHKVFVQSVIWGTNAFDQWGVELGKKLSTEIHEVMQGNKSIAALDPSTAALIERYQTLNARK